jgi:AcrR family transcriptional regulator
MSPRQQRNRERMIQDILGHARDIMREDGVGALSMHELARRLDIQPPSLYNYFSGLMDIYDSLFQLGFQLWDEYVNDYIDESGTWQDQIRMTMEAYMTFAIKNPELYQLCFERPIPGFVPSEKSLQISFGSLEEYYRHIARLKNDIQTDLSTDQLGDLIIAITHGLTALHIANEPEFPLGQGRFGALIPAALSVLDKAWS